MALQGRNYIKKDEWEKFHNFLTSRLLDKNWTIEKRIEIVEAQIE